ncbi:uncharacterized protein NECHADRAFT_99207, partial [Fusarium vanettenii 77-13-4]
LSPRLVSSPQYLHLSFCSYRLISYPFSRTTDRTLIPTRSLVAIHHSLSFSESHSASPLHNGLQARRAARLRPSPRCPSAYLRWLSARSIPAAAGPSARSARLLSAGPSDGILQPAARSLPSWTGPLSSSARSLWPARWPSSSRLLSRRR